MGFKRIFDCEFEFTYYHYKRGKHQIKLCILLITDAICKIHCEEFIKKEVETYAILIKSVFFYSMCSLS